MASAATRSRPSADPIPEHPDRDLKVEQLLTSRGVDWEFRPDLALDWFDHEESLRNQARTTALRDDVVQRYLIRVQRGDRPPAVVTESNGVRVDGNHRAESLRLAAEKDSEFVPTLSAYVITDVAQQTISVLKVELNNLHGEPPTYAERVMHAISLMQFPNILAKEVAFVTGLPESTVRNEAARAKADARARRLNLVGFEQLPGATRLRIGSVRTDAGFTALYKLTREARLSANDVSAIVTDANRHRSEAEQQRVVDQARADHQSRIRVSSGGMADIPTSASPFSLFRNLNQLLRLDFDTMLEVVTDPHERRNLAGRCEEVNQLLEGFAVKLRTT